MLYFAYGSNMYLPHLFEHVPEKYVTFIGTACLDDYIFRYRKASTSGAGNIENRKGSKVYGIVLDINKKGFPNLNKKECTHKRVYCCRQVTVSCNGKKKKCSTYMMYDEKDRDEIAPTDEYRSMLLASADLYGFPAKYKKRLNYK